MVQNKTYLAIDLKSFYASVECVERGLDAMKTNLVVADKERTSKTICLAVSPSLKRYGIPGRARLFEVIEKVITDVLKSTGITATAGIGTNLYLAKVAMDIVAKHIPPDKNGVRIAELDKMSYRQKLWEHRPLTSFWRVGRGYAKKLEAQKLYTMGDIARCSIGKATDYYNEELLYRMFGVNAELLIDHAWGWEPCTIADIKAYKPDDESYNIFYT